MSYFDLIEEFPKPGCVVCNLLLRDVDRFLDSLLYERVNEPDTHRAFRASRGLCEEHGWQLMRYRGGSTGIAILYQAALDEVLKIVDETIPAPASPTGLSRFLPGNGDLSGSLLADRLQARGSCMACALMAGSEAGYVRLLAEKIGDSRLQDVYRASDGLCLPHFRQVLRQVRNPDHLRQLVSLQITIWEKLKAELMEFIDKNDHRRIREALGPEGDSWQRAIARMAGEKGVFGVERRSS